jgi:heptaprenyl diphosphate synthase
VEGSWECRGVTYRSGVTRSGTLSNPVLALGFMERDLVRIEAALLASVHHDDPFLAEIAAHLIKAGGKRLRPVMTVASAVALTGDDATVTDDVVLGGVSCELVQVGSLYHDDVMDEAEVRRSVPSVNAQYGNLRAILAGDFLLARASEIAASLGVEVAALLARTIGRLVEGQLGELQTAFVPERTVAQYESSIAGKTASLFAASCRIGAIVAGHPRPVIDAFTEYGHALGMVFQIVDDVLDVTRTEAELGKPAGHDLVEGVYTLPVICTLDAGSVASDELFELLGRRTISTAEVDKALAIVRSNGGVAMAKAAGQRWAEQARDALDVLDDNEVAAALRAAPLALVAAA